MNLRWKTGPKSTKASQLSTLYSYRKKNNILLPARRCASVVLAMTCVRPSVRLSVHHIHTTAGRI